MKQRGYAILLLLPTLLVITVSISILQPSIGHKSVRQLQVLTDARHQLIAYSASYLESYKPTGAGPGHLPCPDTDWSPNTYKVQAGLRGDGPNPPCGKDTIAVGKLPRHITNGKNRYAFHLEDKHALWYAVDTRFINNPVNRVVNPDTIGRIDLVDALPAAAMVFIPRDAASLWVQDNDVVSNRLREALQGGQGLDDLEDAISQYVLITPELLLKAVSQRIALWMHEQYQTSTLFTCVSDRACAYIAVSACGIPIRSKAMLILLQAHNSVNCDGTPKDIDRVGRIINDSKLDSVYLRRHWFFRNNWWKHVDIQVADTCAKALNDCSAMVQAATNDQRITLYVKPL